MRDLVPRYRDEYRTVIMTAVFPALPLPITSVLTERMTSIWARATISKPLQLNIRNSPMCSPDKVGKHRALGAAGYSKLMSARTSAPR